MIKFFKNISDSFKKITYFYSIIFYIIFLHAFHQAYFSIVIIIPAVLLIMKKYKNNKYFKEDDLLIIVFAITLAFIMKFIISYFSELNVVNCIAISILITLIISFFIIIISAILTYFTKPFFKYLNLD